MFNIRLRNLLIGITLLLLTQILFGSDNLHVADLGVNIKYYDVIGKGEASNSNVPAIRKHDAYLEAKNDALEKSAEFLEGIKNNKNRTLKDITIENSNLIVVFEETLNDIKVIDRKWDKDDNVTIKIRINLEKFKNRLKEIGVK